MGHRKYSSQDYEQTEPRAKAYFLTLYWRRKCGIIPKKYEWGKREVRQRKRKNKYEKAHNWNNECLLPSAAKYVTPDIQLQKVMWNTAGQSREGVRMENNFSSSSYLHWSMFCPRKHQVSCITSFLIWVPSSFPGKPQGGRWVTVPSWRWWAKQYLERVHIEQIIAVHLGQS